MRERMKWRLFYAYSYTVGVLALVVVGPFLFANGQLQDRPFQRIAETAREHADNAYPDGSGDGGQP